MNRFLIFDGGLFLLCKDFSGRSDDLVHLYLFTPFFFFEVEISSCTPGKLR